MSFVSQSNMKWLALALILATVSIADGPAWADTSPASTAVETYTDQAIPNEPVPQYDRYNSPLKAGQMTLEDVLKANPKPQPLPPLVPPSVKPGTNTAPLLSPASGASSTNIMLMQGMKSLLQQSGTGSPTKLQAPQIAGGGVVPLAPGAAPAPQAAYAPPTPIAVGLAPGVSFEPGQAPKNLAGAAAPSADIPQSTEASDVAPVMAPSSEPAPAVPPSKTAKATGPTKVMAGCEPQISSWSKTCVEAGYPASFTGKITGETRIVCPDGSLQDVWIANSCAPPDDGTAGNMAPPQASGSSDSASSGQVAPNETLPPLVSPRNMGMPKTDANCGASNGLAADQKPTSDLCTFGDASDVNGDGPWRWNCKGISGGMTVSCAAPVAASTQKYFFRNAKSY